MLEPRCERDLGRELAGRWRAWLPEPFRLREEAREEWEHFVTDEIVYGSEDFGAVARLGPFSAKDYAEGRLWLEVRGRFVGERDFCAVIEVLDIQSFNLGDGHPHFVPTDGNGVVLVDSAQQVERPERKLFRFPSVVWLKTADPLGGGGIHPGDGGLEASSVGPDVDGKAGLVSDFRTVLRDEGAGKMVESGAALVDKFPRDDAQFRGRISMGFDANDLAAGLRVELLGHSARFRCIEGVERPMKGLSMFVRPHHLQPWPMEPVGRHEVHSKYGTESNDAEGHGDPGPAKGRVGEGSAESREPEGLNYRPTAREVGRTSPGDASGGYSATHTRSGSPEDA